MSSILSQTTWSICSPVYGENVFARGNGFPIMVHEIAHQWFGDSVTTNDWNHVWLSEGFATYLTHLYFEAEIGRERLVDGMQKDRQRVIRSAASHPDQPLVDERLPVERTLTGDAYQKGAWVLHMLRHKIGDEHFWDGLREYYKRYRESNCSSAEFQQVMQDVSGIDLEEFFEQWLYAPSFQSSRELAIRAVDKASGHQTSANAKISQI